MTLTSSLGESLRHARDAAGYSQDRLGAELGTTRQIIIGWEKDRHRPSLRYRRRLAEVLGCADLFGDDDDEEDD